MWCAFFVIAQASQPASEAAALPTSQPAETTASLPASQGFETLVHGKRSHRIASALRIEVGELATIPRANATELLTLAPGIMLTQEGGDGHPERIYMRGFDAREGQDLELSVADVPVNESGNPHGNGAADLHFVIPETVEAVDVEEGPFDLSQGNYAVAGSAAYRLGVPDRGFRAKYTYGSFNTHRVLALVAPASLARGTFAAGELYTTDGFGANRSALRGSVTAQWQQTWDSGLALRAGAQLYMNRYKSAGVVREDDVRAGRVDFYGTYDARQGGESDRYSGWLTLESTRGPLTHSHTVFAVARALRLLQNFTGFLLDVEHAEKLPHSQRGDLLDSNSRAFMAGIRGQAEYKLMLFGLEQSARVGYFARGDFVDARQDRVEATADGDVPYSSDMDLDSKLGNIGGFIEAAVRPWKYLQVRGGLRGDLHFFNVLDRCAQQDVRRPLPSHPPGDEQCLDQQDFGAYRLRHQHYSASGVVLLPRASLVLGEWKGFSLSGAIGRGARSVDPVYVSEGTATPFATLLAYEGGLSWRGRAGPVRIFASGVGFATHVERDLVFSEAVGRNVLGGSTMRFGGSLLTRARGSFFDVNTHITLTRSTFDDTQALVPYSPDVVFRADASVFGPLPWLLGSAPVRLQLSAGLSAIGRRPLPFGQRSDDIVLLDATGSAAWRWFQIGVTCTNLLDRRYRLAELNYASDFHTRAAPTLVPARHFTPGAPRAIFVFVSATIGGEP